MSDLVERLNAGGYCLNVAFGYGIKAKIENCGCGQEGHGAPSACWNCGDIEHPLTRSGECLSCAGVI